ncbi:MAG: DUF531 family protein [Candidatus Thermoplasmatota archaeon]|nr:DUF531 family protein [Candidatus Thermoplasmatota archaeon]
MSRSRHNPSTARRIAKEIRRGESPEGLLPLARSISDPYYRSLGLVSIASSVKSRKPQSIFESALKEVGDVKQTWRRIELLGEITKSLKAVSDENLKNRIFDKVLMLALEEEEEDAKDFIVKYSKNYPDELLGILLAHSINLAKYSFESSKAVIRIWVKRKAIDSLISNLSELKGDLKSRLLGYLHFQLSKSRIQIEPTALSLALQAKNSEEILRYLVRVCSSPSDLDAVASSLSEESPAIMLSLTARADRKGWSPEAHKFATEAKQMIESLESSDKKEKLQSKLKVTIEKLNGIETSRRQPIPVLSEIAKSGKHTLGLFNTYGGKWNHPHFKAIHKAANLCSAFDLNLALIGFPGIESDKLVGEIRKEMRLPNEGHLSSLFSNQRVRFFDKDIDETWTGSKIATTANPDPDKLNIPDGKLCMIMGLGPKGLPKSFLESSSCHFELTGSNVAFETGTAMGSIAGRLSLM